jgi:hypothetical protein
VLRALRAYLLFRPFISCHTLPSRVLPPSRAGIGVEVTRKRGPPRRGSSAERRRQEPATAAVPAGGNDRDGGRELLSVKRVLRFEMAGPSTVGRSCAGGVADPAAGAGWRAGAEPGDPAEEDEEVAGAALPCSAEGGPEGAVGGLWSFLRGFPRGGRKMAGRRPRSGVPGRELPAGAAVRDGLRRRRRFKREQAISMQGRER